MKYTIYGYANNLKSAIGYNGDYVIYQNNNSQLYLLGNGVRLYNPALKKFYSCDPFVPSYKAGINAYTFVNNDPVNYNDPSGYMISSKQLSDSSNVAFRLDSRSPEEISRVGFAGNTWEERDQYGSSTVFASKSLAGVSNFLFELQAKFSANKAWHIESSEREMLGVPKSNIVNLYRIDNLDEHKFVHLAQVYEQSWIKRFTDTHLKWSSPKGSMANDEVHIQGPVKPENITYLDSYDLNKVAHDDVFCYVQEYKAVTLPKQKLYMLKKLFESGQNDLLRIPRVPFDV